MIHSNQEILTNFLEAICRIVSEGTSDTYAAMVIRKFNKSNSKEFPVVKYIHFEANRFNVDKKVNNINPKFIGKFIKKIINSLFSDLFKRMVKREIDVGLLRDLKSIGVRIWYL